MPDQHRQPGSWKLRSDEGLAPDDSLPATADATCGSGNLETTPRAGNISSDARAGGCG